MEQKGERSARTKGRLLVAARYLMSNGNIRPEGLEVANVAYVSHRTLFNHFANLAQLYEEALADEGVAQKVVDYVMSASTPTQRARRIVGVER